MSHGAIERRLFLSIKWVALEAFYGVKRLIIGLKSEKIKPGNTFGCYGESLRKYVKTRKIW